MNETPALLGIMDLGWQIMRLLAVVGGVATGALAGGWLLRGLGRLAVRRKAPQLAVRMVQGLGGVGMGVAVWLWVYGEGGGGPGRGGLWGKGDGAGEISGLASLEPTKGGLAPEGTSTEAGKQPAPAEGAPGDTLRIELLGGARVREGRFYVVDGEREARTLTDLRRRLEDSRRQTSKTPLKSIELVIYMNSVAEDHAAVRDLRKWARENDLEVKTISLDRELP